MGGRVDLAIVIVNYNTCQDLDSCLASIAQSEGEFTRAVVVVDNASEDGSVEMVRTRHPWVDRLIVTERNGGYAYANNIGLRALGFGEDAPKDSLPHYVLLLNPDTILPPTALKEMLDFMDRSPDVGAAGPKLVRPDGRLDLACRRSFPTPEISFYRMVGLSKLFPSSPRFGRYNMTFLDPDVETDVDAVVGAFMLMRAEALQAAGLLDEAFFMYGEDLDLCYRIKEKGWRIVYHPQVTVVHVKGASSRKSSRRAIAAFYEAMRIFHNKHYRASTPAPINVLIDVGISVFKTLALWRDRLRPAERKRVASA